jgi:hypothetical protein
MPTDAVDPAIAQVPQGHFALVDVLTVLGTQEQRPDDVLPPNHGQI